MGAGSISAPAIGKLTIHNRFDADLSLTGNKDPNQATLGSASIGGGISDASWKIAGKINSLTVKGAVSNWELSADALGTARFGELDRVILNVAKTLTSFQSQRFVDSTLTAGIISTFTATGTVGSPAPAFANSNVAATTIGNVNLASVASNNGGTKYGIKAEESIGSVRVKTPLFKFDKTKTTPQGIGDFEVKIEASSRAGSTSFRGIQPV
jgi:hypothetical protein